MSPRFHDFGIGGCPDGVCQGWQPREREPEAKERSREWLKAETTAFQLLPRKLRAVFRELPVWELGLRHLKSGATSKATEVCMPSVPAANSCKDSVGQSPCFPHAWEDIGTNPQLISSISLYQPLFRTWHCKAQFSPGRLEGSCLQRPLSQTPACFSPTKVSGACRHMRRLIAAPSKLPLLRHERLLRPLCLTGH